MSESGVEAIISGYFSRLKHALAPMPRSRRNQLLDDLREHVAMARADLADESELSVREILDHLGAPEEIAAEALAGSRRGAGRWRGRWPLGPSLAWFNQGRPARRRAIVSAAAAVALAAGTCGAILADSSPPPAAVKTETAQLANVPLANSDCSPQTDAATSGGPAAALTSKATEVASGTAGGNRWSLWSAHGQSGATGLEDGGLVINDRAYGLCPGFPNPAELELADVGRHGIAFGVIGYPGLAKVHVYTSIVDTFDTGQALPAPTVRVVHGVTFFIGALPRSACAYPSLELNSAARQGSSQHNFGFGSCVAGKLVEITGSMGAWSAGQ